MNKKRTTLYKQLLSYMFVIDFVMAFVIVIENVCFGKIMKSANPDALLRMFGIGSFLFVV